METLAEYLKSKENQMLVLERIIFLLRSVGKWGKRGLYAQIAENTGFSAAYVGQVLKGKKPLTDEFVGQIADYLEVTVEYLSGKEAEPYDPFKVTAFFKVLLEYRMPESDRKILETGIEKLSNSDVSDADYIKNTSELLQCATKIISQLPLNIATKAATKYLDTES